MNVVKVRDGKVAGKRMTTMPVQRNSLAASKATQAVHGRIITAMPLSLPQQRRITRRFEQILGKRVEFSCRLERQQLAGVRVEIDGYSYDGTARGQLMSIQKMLTSPDEEG